MENFNQIRDSIEQSLKKIDAGQGCWVELRAFLVVAAKHRYLSIIKQDFNLTRKKDRERLRLVADRFLTAKLITKSTLKDRGWTDGTIAKFLVKADVETKNPVIKTGAPMKLYSLDRVEQVEAVPEVRAALDRTASQKSTRSAAASTAAETRRSKLMDWVAELEVEIPIFEIQKLLNLSVNHYNHFWQDRRGSDSKHATIRDDADFLRRIVINFLRHECTDYEDRLLKLFGKVGRDEAYCEIKDKVNNKIIETYPCLYSQIQEFQEEVRSIKQAAKLA